MYEKWIYMCVDILLHINTHMPKSDIQSLLYECIETHTNIHTHTHRILLHTNIHIVRVSFIVSLTNDCEHTHTQTHTHIHTHVMHALA